MSGSEWSTVASNGFGALLRELRERCGLSQAELARRAGVNHTTISRLERGQRHPSRLMVLRLARALATDESMTARLLASAGHTPVSLEIHAELAELSFLLSAPHTPDAVRRLARSTLSALVEGLRQAAESQSVRRSA